MRLILSLVLLFGIASSAEAGRRSCKQASQVQTTAVAPVISKCGNPNCSCVDCNCKDCCCDPQPVKAVVHAAVAVVTAPVRVTRHVACRWRCHR